VEVIDMRMIADRVNQKQASETVKKGAGFETSHLKNLHFLVLYAEEDEVHANNLNKHLFLLKRSGQITLHLLHKDALAGEDPWRKAQDQLPRTDYVLCLLTANFLSSELLLNFALSSGKRLIPILVNHVSMEGSGMEKLRSLPGNQRAIADFPNEDQAYREVVDELRRLIPA
jgi:hypothetical protein